MKEKFFSGIFISFPSKRKSNEIEDMQLKIYRLKKIDRMIKPQTEMRKFYLKRSHFCYFYPSRFPAWWLLLFKLLHYLGV